MEQQPKKPVLKKRTVITFLLSLGFLIFIFHCVNVYNNLSKVNYYLMQNDTMQAVVLIKEPVEKEIDSVRVERIADSLYNNKPESNVEYARWYRVQFFYTKNWKENMYYAQKSWSANYGKLIPGKLEITHITGDAIQDSIYDAKLNLQKDRNLQSRP